jgi:hypothetical protein
LADNYVTFSECIDELTPEEENWLTQQLEVIYVYGDKEYTIEDIQQGKANDLDDCYQDWSGYRYLRTLHNYQPNDNAPFEYEFIDRGSRRMRLWIYTDDCGNPEYLAELVQRFLKKFRHDQYWTLSWANTCSRLESSGFSGGAAFITADTIDWCITDEFLESKTEAFNEDNYN